MRADIETVVEDGAVVAYFEPCRENCCLGRGATVQEATDDLRCVWLDAVNEELAEHGCDGLSVDKAESVWARRLTLEQTVQECVDDEYDRALAEAPDLHMQPDWYQRAHADEMRRRG